MIKITKNEFAVFVYFLAFLFFIAAAIKFVFMMSALTIMLMGGVLLLFAFLMDVVTPDDEEIIND